MRQIFASDAWLQLYPMISRSSNAGVTHELQCTLRFIERRSLNSSPEHSHEPPHCRLSIARCYSAATLTDAISRFSFEIWHLCAMEIMQLAPSEKSYRRDGSGKNGFPNFSSQARLDFLACMVFKASITGEGQTSLMQVGMWSRLEPHGVLVTGYAWQRELEEDSYFLIVLSMWILLTSKSSAVIAYVRISFAIKDMTREWLPNRATTKLPQSPGRLPLIAESQPCGVQYRKRFTLLAQILSRS